MHGQSSSAVPTCLSARARCKYGRSHAGSTRSIHDDGLIGPEEDTLREDDGIDNGEDGDGLVKGDNEEWGTSLFCDILDKYLLA
jgi:hypothetical protein